MLNPDHETKLYFLNYEAIAGTVVELLNDEKPTRKGIVLLNRRSISTALVGQDHGERI